MTLADYREIGSFVALLYIIFKFFPAAIATIKEQRKEFIEALDKHDTRFASAMTKIAEQLERLDKRLDEAPACQNFTPRLIEGGGGGR